MCPYNLYIKLSLKPMAARAAMPCIFARPMAARAAMGVDPMGLYGFFFLAASLKNTVSYGY